MLLIQPVPDRCRQAFRWDALSGLLGGLQAGMIIPFAPVIARRLGGSALEISLIVMAPFLGSLFALQAARLSQRRSDKISNVVKVSLAARLPLLLLAAPENRTLLVAIMVVSLAIGPFQNPSYVAVMRTIYPDQHRARLMGIARMAVVIGTMAGALIAGPLIDLWSYRVVFPLAALVGVLSSLSFRQIPRSEFGGEPEEPATLAIILRILREDRSFRGFSVAAFINMFGALMIASLVPIFMVDRLHISSFWVGLVTTSGSVVSLIAYYLWGHFIDRHGPIWSSLSCFALYGLYPALFLLARPLGGAPGLIPAFAIAGIVGAGWDLGWWAILILYARSERLAAYCAIQSVAAGVRGVIAPLAGALLYKQVLGLEQVFLLSSAIALMGALLAFRLFPQRMGENEDSHHQ